MGYKAVNNATSTLAAGITAVATSLSVATSQGDRFPIITAPDYTYLTIENAGGLREVVKVTARTAGADTMTIVRAQDATTARAWSSGDVVDLRLTAVTVTEAFDHISDTSAAHAASAIGYAGSAGLAATDVEGALDELDTEKAPLASPAFTGNPTAPTPATADDDTSIATTAYVKASTLLSFTTIDEVGLVNGAKVGYRNIPQNAQALAYTLTLADAGKHVYYTGGAATLTVPTNASVAYPIGSAITLINNGSGALTISTASLTMNFAGTASVGNRTLAAKGLCTLIKVATDTWFISGVGLT